MNCEDLRELYELYVMGVAGEPERSEIREHLNRGCEDCMAGIKRATKLVALLGGAADPAVPSPKLRKRILASVGSEQRSYGTAPYFAAAAAMFLFAAIYFNGRERGYEHDLAGMRVQMGRQSVELTHLNEAMAILSGPGTREVNFAAGPAGKVFINRTQGVLLIASNLPPAPAGKIYEMWIIPKAGAAVPAGLFQSQSDGAAMHLRRGPVDDGVTVAVTVENESGSAQPTSTPIIVAAPQ